MTMISQPRPAGGVLGGVIAFLLLIACVPQATAQPLNADEAAIRAALAKWTADFNAGEAQAVCGLFAPDLVYDYRGYPERNYKDLCDLLQGSLSDRTKRYAYALAIKEILVSGDLAVVRLVWTLKVTGSGVPGEVVSEEPGMDVFHKQPDGSWKIIRYIAYESPR